MGYIHGLDTDAVPDMTDFPQPPQTPDDPQPKKSSENTTNPVVEGLQTLGLSIVLALGIRTFVAEARYIPSGSMQPTLEINDRLVVEKISYHLNPPERGDIIVFWPPDSLFQEERRRDAFIKRVIGLPGETVEITDGQVIIDGAPLSEDYIKAEPNYTWGPRTVPDESYLVLGDNRNSSYDSHAWEPESFVPAENIIGKAVVRFWPPSRIGGLE